MGMSTHVVGFIPPDEQWHKMVKVYNACRAAGLPVPKECEVFFDYEDPAGLPGREVVLKKGVQEYRADMRDGYDIHLDQLPKEVKIIRVYNSY